MKNFILNVSNGVGDRGAVRVTVYELPVFAVEEGSVSDHIEELARWSALCGSHGYTEAIVDNENIECVAMCTEDDIESLDKMTNMSYIIGEYVDTIDSYTVEDLCHRYTEFEDGEHIKLIVPMKVEGAFVRYIL